MHGGARGSGAPDKNRNALKHGQTTREAIESRKKLRQLLGEAQALLEKIDEDG